jgi:uncharacterized membrane protein
LLDDRSDQVAIAVFAATFAFALLSLRAVDTGRGTHVPSVTVLTALALAIASGVALFFFISHAGYRLRVAGLVDLVGDQLRSELAKRYPAQVPPSGQNDPDQQGIGSGADVAPNGSFSTCGNATSRGEATHSGGTAGPRFSQS